MLTTIRTYLNLRQKGMSKAWDIAGMPEVGDKAVGVLLKAVAAACFLFLISDYANSAQEAVAAKLASTVKQQASEIVALRKIVAACLGDKEGALYIGGQLHMCRAVPTGIMQ